MGAEIFYTTESGATVGKAFRRAVKKAEYEYGHAGYTGTIAEKDSYVVIDMPEGAEPIDYALQLVHEGDPRVDDKWGPAGAIKISDNVWLFFGLASS